MLHLKERKKIHTHLLPSCFSLPSKVHTLHEKWITIIQWIAFIPLIGFAFQTHEFVVAIFGVLRPIEDSVGIRKSVGTEKADLFRRKMKAAYRATALSMGTLFIAYTTIGISGALAFGVSVHPDVMYNFKAESPFVLAGMEGLAEFDYW